MAQLIFRYADSENSRAFAQRMEELSGCCVLTAAQFIEGAKDNKNTLIILDAHLLRKADVQLLRHMADDDGVSVICCGQRADRTGEPFEGSKYLMAICDAIKNGDSMMENEYEDAAQVSIADDEAVPEVLLSFLDAQTSAEKIDIIRMMQNSLNDDIINAMAASLDTQIRSGDIADRISELMGILEVRKKYECTRLR